MSAIKKNHVKVFGDGPKTMVFAHGFGCSQNMWRFVAPAFREGYRIVLFDHIGAGQSDVAQYDSTKYSSLDGYVDDLLDIYDELDLRETVFVGHSVSAMIGILAAIRRPDLFAKLVLIGPSPCYINQDGYAGGFDRAAMERVLEFLDTNYESWSRMMAPTIMGNLDRPELGAELTESFCRLDPVVARQFARVTFLSDNRADLDLLDTPALILQCSEDPISPDFVGDYVHSRLKNSHLIKLRATGHCPNMSEPEETIEAIKAFL